MKKNLLFIVLIAVSQVLTASVFNGQIMSFQQPDGSSVDVKLYGTEYYMRGEGLDGYTVVRDKKTNWICYATIAKDGSELVSTGIAYQGVQNNMSTLKTGLSMAQHLDLSMQAKKEIIRKNKIATGALQEDAITGKLTDNGVDQQIATTPVHQVSGQIKGLCIVVDFSDEPGTLPISEFEDFCNDFNYTNFGNNGSLRRFYYDISGGLVDYENVVFGYYRAPLTFAQYDAMSFAQGAKQVLGQALTWIDNQGFDFSTLSINPDGSIQAINLMYTGHPPTWAEGMWFHKGNYGGFSADGVHSDDYNCSPANSPLELAVVAHENGHMIGKWPDTYKYDSNNGADGLGTFDLMCYYGELLNPSIPNPLFRSNVGWGRVEDVTFYNGINIDTANSMTCYKYRNLSDTNEFFLLESRMQSGRSHAIDDEGLTIWHVDRNGDNQTVHHEIYLEHASNDNTFHTEACFKQGFNEEFAINTAPDSRWYNGDPSGLRVWDIGPAIPIMNYKLGMGAAGPSLFLVYNNLSGDSNGNGFVESGESATIQVDASNFGQMSSGTCTVTCVAVGPNAGYVTVNTFPVNAGVLNASQTAPASFNFTLDPSTPIGTPIDLKFMLSDGTSGTYITRHLIVGVIVPMSDNVAETECNALFYDEGTESNYSNNTDFTKTFYPVNAGDAVLMNFTEFELEDFTNCGYDYLKIYDGPNTSSPLIGTYCGFDSPGQVISTDIASGALTFDFHADEGVTALGWKAVVSCVAGVSLNEHPVSNALKVFPNPSAGLLTISLPGAEELSISLYDVTGREVFATTTKSGKDLQLDLRDKPNGFYFLSVKAGKEAVTRKIVVNK
jgi:M6 family metalloprotease-like protein